MFEVEFYEDRKGRQPVREVLIDLKNKAAASKDARIQYEKMLVYIKALENYGTRVGEPIVKHIDGNLWELRPLSHRILFFYWRDNTFGSTDLIPQEAPKDLLSSSACSIMEKKHKKVWGHEPAKFQRL